MYILQTGINDGRTMSFIYPASPPFETISFQEYFDNAPLSDADTELTNGVEDIETVEEHAVVNGTYTAMSNNKGVIVWTIFFVL